MKGEKIIWNLLHHFHLFSWISHSGGSAVTATWTRCTTCSPLDSFNENFNTPRRFFCYVREDSKDAWAPWSDGEQCGAQEADDDEFQQRQLSPNLRLSWRNRNHALPFHFCFFPNVVYLLLVRPFWRFVSMIRTRATRVSYCQCLNLLFSPPLSSDF